MTFAAVAAMTYVGSAVTLSPSVCTDCGAYGVSDCDTIVFKVTGSGKAVVPKAGYKATTSIKIKKGALALEGEYCALTDTCCYETGWFYATIKAGKKTFALATQPLRRLMLTRMFMHGQRISSLTMVSMKQLRN